MALVGFDDDPLDQRQRRRVTVPGLQTPETPDVFRPQAQPSAPRIPTPQPGPQMPKPKTARDFGIDSDAPAAWQRFDNTGFYYDWRSQPYQSPLGQGDIDAQRREYQFRNQNPQQELPDDSAGIAALLAGMSQAPQQQSQQPQQAPRPAPQPQVQAPPQQPAVSLPTPQPTQVPGQFTDPITSVLEAFAQQRAQALENPAPNSGQALLENMLRSQAQQFQSGGYTPAEQEIFQTQAIEPIEQLRSARKQQVMQNLSARGIDPRSGVGMQMLRDVDRQMDAMRIETQRTLAGNAAQERTKRMLQAVELLSGLAGQERNRANEAFQFRGFPLQLADRAFNQATQAYNAGGNPLTLAQPLLQLQSLQQGRSDNWQEALGYLAAMLSNS